MLPGWAIAADVATSATFVAALPEVGTRSRGNRSLVSGNLSERRRIVSIDNVSIGEFAVRWFTYRGMAFSCRWSEGYGSGHVTVNVTVSAGISNMAVEGSGGAEEGGIGLGLAFEFFGVGENAA